MPERSWLAKVTSIYDLGSWNSCERDWDRDNVERECAKDNKLRDHHAKGALVAPEHAHHFHGAMHDDYILSEERDGNKAYHLRVHCRYAGGFYEHMAELFGRQHGPTFFPVEFVAEQVHYVRWSYAAADGQLRFWRPDWSEPFVELLNDWFFNEQGRIQWIVRAHALAPYLHVYGMIDTEEFRVIDHRERLLTELWGADAGALWREIALLPAYERSARIRAMT